MKFGELFRAFDKQEMLKLSCFNAVLYQGQIEKFEMEKFPNLDKVEVKQISSGIDEIAKNKFPYIAVLLLHIVSFEERADLK